MASGSQLINLFAELKKRPYTKILLVLGLAVPLVTLVGIFTSLAQARQSKSVRLSSGNTPTVISYQGQVAVNEAPFNGIGQFRTSPTKHRF